MRLNKPQQANVHRDLQTPKATKLQRCNTQDVASTPLDDRSNRCYHTPS